MHSSNLWNNISQYDTLSQIIIKEQNFVLFHDAVIYSTKLHFVLWKVINIKILLNSINVIQKNNYKSFYHKLIILFLLLK